MKVPAGDRIWLYGIACRVRVGVPAAERRRRQLIFIDLGLESDVSRPAAKDDLWLAVDYQRVAAAVRLRAEAGERRLVETLAEQVAAEVLRSQKGVKAVSVRVEKKPRAMLGVRVVVEIFRKRGKYYGRMRSGHVILGSYIHPAGPEGLGV